MIPEPHTLGGELIEIRRLNEPIAHATQRIETLIVGEDENKVELANLVGLVEG